VRSSIECWLSRLLDFFNYEHPNLDIYRKILSKWMFKKHSVGSHEIIALLTRSTHRAYVSQDPVQQIMPYRTELTLQYKGLLVTRSAVSLTAAKFTSCAFRCDFVLVRLRQSADKAVHDTVR
jgi:hypothetical protein